MALSGTLYAYSGNITLKVIWSAKQSIEGNYSTIKVDTHIVHNTGKIKTNYTGSGNLMYKKTWSIAAYNSTTYSDTNYHDELLNSMEVAIPHNADGTLSGVLSVSIPEVSYWLPGKPEAKTGTLTASGTIILDTIARATQPTLSVSSVEMNSKLVINMPSASSAFTHTLTYSFGSASGGEIFMNIKEGIEDAFKLVVNKIIEGINTVISKSFSGMNDAITTLKGTVILGVKPFDYLKTFDVPQIPMLEEGGVLKKGQVGLLEGKGAEAVVPLEKNTGWLDKIAERLNAGTAPADNKEIIAKLNELIQFIKDLRIYLYGDVLVGELAPAMDAKLGTIYAGKERGR